MNTPKLYDFRVRYIIHALETCAALTRESKAEDVFLASLRARKALDELLKAILPSEVAVEVPAELLADKDAA